MSAEYLAAVGSIASAVIIGATAIAALIQLRHMHSANSSNAMLALRTLFDDERHSAARNAVRRGAAEEAMRDPGFRRYVASFAADGRPAPEAADYAQLIDMIAILGNTFETIGTMVKQGTIEKTEFLDLYSFVIDTSWRRLEAYIAYTRACPGNGDSLFENFEYLTILAREWKARHPTQFPANMRRLPLANAYPVEADAAPARAEISRLSAKRTVE
jgi:hypothetical protein